MRRQKTYFPRDPSAPAPLTATATHRLMFSEVDMMTVAWNGNYLKFFELAHTELFNRLGLTFDAYKAANLAAPIVQLHVDYFTPLFLNELFTVQASLVWSDGARLNVEYKITHADGTIAATGYTVQMFVDIAARAPLMIVPDLYAALLKNWRAGSL